LRARLRCEPERASDHLARAILAYRDAAAACHALIMTPERAGEAPT
jgi:hypothetical protein